MEGGYLCGGGDCFVEHDEIGRWVNNPNALPKVEHTNISLLGGAAGRFTHPPPVDFWQPMHRVHAGMARKIRAMARQGSIFGVPAEIKGGCDCVDGFVVKVTGDEAKRTTKYVNDAANQSGLGYHLGSGGSSFGFGH